MNSAVCRKGVEQFWQGAEQTGGRYVEDKSRLLKVLKTTVTDQQMPRPLVDIFSPLIFLTDPANFTGDPHLVHRPCTEMPTARAPRGLAPLAARWERGFVERRRAVTEGVTWTGPGGRAGSEW